MLKSPEISFTKWLPTFLDGDDDDEDADDAGYDDHVDAQTTKFYKLSVKIKKNGNHFKMASKF